jgi:uncharacterized membrane protein YidH (DUF202 family)
MTTPQVARVGDAPTTNPGSRPLRTPLLLVGLRCIARYVVLPFVLPVLAVAFGATPGIVSGIALGVLVILDVGAVVSIIATLRWLWRHRHPRRWLYLPAAVALIVLVAVFFANDVRLLYVQP